jgi:DNA polymerase elongation subunit (family B)
MGMQPKILIYDIETSYFKGASWATYDTNLLFVEQDWHMMSFAWKWLGKKQTYVLALPDFPEYKDDPLNDYPLVERLHQLMSHADIVIAHNGDKFDQKKAHARMIMLGMKPPEPYKSIDTLKVARKYFKFTSNHLDDLGEYLKVGHKLETGGIGLWRSCEEGNMKAWEKMKKYNKQDVILLEKVYEKLQPWINNHPSMSLLLNNPEGCPKCGKGPLTRAGTRMTKLGRQQRFQCNACGGWSMSRRTETDREVKYVN